MVKTILFLLLIVFWGTISAQSIKPDSYKSGKLNTSDSSKRVGSTLGRSNFSLKSAIVPISLVTAGIIVETLPSNALFSKQRIQQQVQEKMNGFKTSADNYLQFVPIAAMFGLKLADTKSRSDLLNQMIITAKSEMLVSAIVFSMKHFIPDMRPDGSTDNSMPSGHTAQAFASATLLAMEYRDTSPWISIGGYLCATATGFLRVSNDRHWASDVLIGAGIGIASVKLVYLTHQYRYKRIKMSNVVLVPTLFQKGGGVAFAMKF
ncbi:MAG: phosphatase PAP2 family protein [Prolixibacteraceae bacterium]